MSAPNTLTRHERCLGAALAHDAARTGVQSFVAPTAGPGTVRGDTIDEGAVAMTAQDQHAPSGAGDADAPDERREGQTLFGYTHVSGVPRCPCNDRGTT